MTAPVLIVGGYGVVGFQLAQIIRNRHPDLPLILAGRTEERATEAARNLGNAIGAVVDVTKPGPLANLPTDIGGIVGAVNDPSNHLLRAAIECQIPYVDITRWTERLLLARELAESLDPKSPVTFASSWMAGVAAMVAKATADKTDSVRSIETNILFRLADKAGPNSVEYADRLTTPFRIWKNGKWQRAKPLTDAKNVEFPSGDTFSVSRFDEPSQETLAGTLAVDSISSRIGYDDPSATRSLKLLVKSGIWALISGARFKKLRHSILYHPGEGAAHEIVINVSGSNSNSKGTILDPQGQTHLTAVGAYIQLHETVGLGTSQSRPPGIHFPENATQIDLALQIFREEGVTVSISN